MARKQSAGTLLFRTTLCRLAVQVEVLLVHPSGNYNRKAPWGIPKGLLDEGETLEQAARRETLEETGIAAGELTAIGSIDYKKSRKTVHAFCGMLPPGSRPRCASWEIDQAEVLPITEAAERIHPDQLPFLKRLGLHLQRMADTPKGDS